MTIRENCLHEIPRETSINQVGILKLNLNCEIIIDTFKISPKFIKTRTQIHDLPVANRTQGIKIMNLTDIALHMDKIPPQPKTVYMNFNEKFNNLHNETTSETKMLNESKLVKKIERNMLRNGIIYLFVFIFVIIVTKILIKLAISKLCK